MATMKISELTEALKCYEEKYGDVPIVLWDLDSSYYFSLANENIEAQRMEDGSVRLSMGLNLWEDESHEDEPAKRPLE